MDAVHSNKHTWCIPNCDPYVLSQIEVEYFLLYMVDGNIYSYSFEDNHIRHVDEICTTIAESSVKIKMQKCTIVRDEIQYLVHLLRSGKL